MTSEDIEQLMAALADNDSARRAELRASSRIERSMTPASNTNYRGRHAVQGAQFLGYETEGRLRRRISAALALHHAYGCTEAGQPGHETCGDREWCYTCGEDTPYPCPTRIALMD